MHSVNHPHESTSPPICLTVILTLNAEAELWAGSIYRLIARTTPATQAGIEREARHLRDSLPTV